MKSILFVLFISAGLMASCQVDPVQPVGNQFKGPGRHAMNQSSPGAEAVALPAEALSEKEMAGLLWMREEERLAHDLYVALYEKWGRQVFSNISQSEAQHTSAVLALLEKYDLEDPSAGLTANQFSFPDLQALFDQLLNSGDGSVTEALKVGALVEEVDLLDLEEQLNEVVDNQDITLVYQQLAQGSRNHLRAFVKNLGQLGITYKPQALDQATFDSIISGSN